MVNTSTIAEKNIWSILAKVCDPEVPVLTILDLGIVRNVQINGEKTEIIITPTYTGCPAMDMIAMNIRLALAEHGYKNVTVTTVLSPAWTTDWMTEEGKQKLKAYGIAPPIQNNRYATINCSLQLKQCNARTAILIIQPVSVNLVPLHVRHYINVRNATSRLIILNATDLFPL